jgi:23S rRNA (adenine2503-C2)-methyltransferase
MAENLRSHTPETLSTFVGEDVLDLGVARRVLFRVVGQGRNDLAGVRGLSKAATLQIEGRLDRSRIEIVERRASAVDPFVKYLFRATDGHVFEAVRIPLEKPRFSLCVSSQVGCALRCVFCETGRLGFARNLDAWEIVDQVLAIRDDSPERPVTGVVFQGQGEPLLNYENVMRAAAILTNPSGGRISGRNMTISTVGILPAILRYADERHPYRLILSLTSAIQERREALLPVARRFPLEDLAHAMRSVAEAQQAPVHVAWVLMAGVNTGPEEVDELVRLFRGAPLRVSVIDVNDPTGRFRRADDAERGRFLSALAAARISFVRRYSGGPDIHAACGMLASRLSTDEADDDAAAPLTRERPAAARGAKP